MKKKSIKNRIIAFAVGIIIMFGLCGACLFEVTIKINTKYTSILNTLLEYTNLSSEITRAYQALDLYIQSENQEKYEEYLEQIEQASASIHSIKENTNSEDIYYYAENLENQIENYRDYNEELYNQYHALSFGKIYPMITKSQGLYDDINMRLNSLTQEQSVLTNREFQQYSRRMTNVFLVVVLIFCLILGLLLTLALRLAKQITAPVEKMAVYAGSIAGGNFDSEDIDESDLAEILNISPYYLSHIFKDTYGVNVIDYLNQVRIKKAKELLAEGEDSVKQIAFETGFTDPNYFCRIFKKYTGVTPSAFRSVNR